MLFSTLLLASVLFWLGCCACRYCYVNSSCHMQVRTVLCREGPGTGTIPVDRFCIVLLLCWLLFIILSYCISFLLVLLLLLLSSLLLLLRVRGMAVFRICPRMTAVAQGFATLQQQQRQTGGTVVPPVQ